MDQKHKKIILTAGGTGGSCTPLLSIAEIIKRQNVDCEFLWIGTKTGPEKAMVSFLHIPFASIAWGKWRRYFSWKNFIDPFKIIIGFVQSIILIFSYKPDLVISGGSFVSVPVVWAAWIFNTKIIAHQQDAQPGLANKLSAPFADYITVTFQKSLKDFGAKAVYTGNFIRPEFFDLQITKKEAKQKIGLDNSLPVVLIAGGGTGSEFINYLTASCLTELTQFCSIIHITGKNRGLVLDREIANYRSFEFMHIDGLIKAYAAADLVISRAGMGMLSELSFFAKPTILIPMPDSHQEKNAEIFSTNKAAIVLSQKGLNKMEFKKSISHLLRDDDLRRQLTVNIKNTIKTDNGQEIFRIINSLLKI